PSNTGRHTRLQGARQERGQGTMTELNTAETISLWAECSNGDPIGNGAEAWNHAIKDRSISAISFQGFTFDSDVDFSNYRFPAANFSSTTFTGEAIFSGAAFSGEAIFIGGKFKQQASFRKTKFSDWAHFNKAEFEQVVFFSHATFTGKSIFINAKFKQNSYFNYTTFTGEANFNEVEFDQMVIFTRATFSDVANFGDATFRQETHFQMARFEGDANFSDIKAEQALIFSLRGSCFDGILRLSSSKPLGCVLDLTEVKNAHPISLERIHCTLKRYLPERLAWAEKKPIWKCLFTGLQFARDDKDSEGLRVVGKLIPEHHGFDQTLPSMTDDPVSERVRKVEKLAQENPKYAQELQFATNGKDSERLRVLKKLAHENKDHTKALEYRVLEFQANRWSSLPQQSNSWWRHALHRGSQTLRAISEFGFWALSNYGRSMLLPAFWLLFLVLGMACAYCSLSSNSDADWDKALHYSLGQTFIWMPAARGQSQSAREAIRCASSTLDTNLVAGCTPNWWVVCLSGFQTLLAVLLIFLFGLGARNRFLI
ncbi:MAG: pentapeptide repeat-containing protein, partial [Gammaproteobacteria bacterium]